MLKLLYQTLKALTNPKIPNRLIRYVFELKALCINGQAPQVFQCTCCGSTGRSMVFSPRKGGLVCTECDGDVIDGILSEEKKEVDQVIISTQELNKYFGQEVTPQQMKAQIVALLDEWKEKQPPEKKAELEK